MDKIRVGVVGVGALGQHHARVYASMPEATLVGVVDPFPGRAEEVAGPLRARVYPAYSDLFDKVDAVSIATPTILHAKIGEQFLKEGVNPGSASKQSRASGWASRTFQSRGRALAGNCEETAFF
jgi:predicted dehydrogenase